MTVLEEIVDLALRVCLNSHNFVQHRRFARAAVLLSETGTTFSGFDINNQQNMDGVRAERAAISSALASGCRQIRVLLLTYYLLRTILCMFLGISYSIGRFD